MVMLAKWFDQQLQAVGLGAGHGEVLRVAADELALPTFAALLLTIFVVPAAHGAARILALTAILAVVAHAAINLARNLRATRESRTARAAMSVAVEAIEGARRAASGLLDTARSTVIPSMTRLNAAAATMASDRRLTASSRKRAAAIQASAAAALGALQTFVDPPASAASGPETLTLAAPEAATASALIYDAAETGGPPEALPAHLALVPVYRPVRPLRVLVAEADRMHQLMLRTLLGQAGIEPEIVAEGAEVVEAWRREPWDLILVDLELPGLNGRATARMIRSVETKMGWSFTPIVALADELTAHELADCVSVGIDRLVTRPITADALYRAIEASVAAPEETELAKVA
jgi:CheY-like chemotaxis protein